MGLIHSPFIWLKHAWYGIIQSLTIAIVFELIYYTNGHSRVWLTLLLCIIEMRFVQVFTWFNSQAQLKQTSTDVDHLCPTEWISLDFPPFENYFNDHCWHSFPKDVIDFHLPNSMLIVDTVQDFLIKLGIKPCLHILEISIFPLNHVILRPTKIMNRTNKDWAHF